MPHNNKQNTITKRNLCEKNVTLFNRYLENKAWHSVYRDGVQKAFTWFHGVIDLFFDKCFRKQPYILTDLSKPLYVDDRQTSHSNQCKNVLGFQAF